MTDLTAEIYRAILTALDGRLNLIGSVIEGDARRETIRQEIYDRGDFLANLGYQVRPEADGLTLVAGSNVRHEPYVLGGKVPSWTPLAPLIGWVERKNLHWVDRKSGEPLTVEQIARRIQFAIHARGIAPRNVFATVIDNREAWIYQQLNDIEVRL